MKIARYNPASDIGTVNLKRQNSKPGLKNNQVFDCFKNFPAINYQRADIFVMPKSISFMGRIVHIVDGGNHATNMKHFANAISNDMDIEMHNVEVNSEDKNIKQLKSLEQELRNLNSRPSNKEKPFEEEYVAIPALASVAILNIQDQYNAIMHDNKKFTPQNIKANKPKLLEFLKKIYENPNGYRRYINYMDGRKQGIEYTYGVIQEINKLKEKGARVYIPSGHPQDETLKWMAGQRGLKPELYHYIATGEDVGGKVNAMCREIKNNKWYDFNLLSLSNAEVVGIKGTSGARDYMFAAYDACITDGERGVYNFSPVRQGGNLVGYSYTDTVTNEYPYSEFPANDEVENLVKFVGKSLYSVLATKEETDELRKAVTAGYETSECADKLYKIEDIFSIDEIRKQKIDIQGRYVDKSLKLFFDTNKRGQVIFPKCDCEGSGKPSVLPMWGSCFALFNAIAREIKLDEANKKAWENHKIEYGHDLKFVSNIDSRIDTLNEMLEKASNEGNLIDIERLANRIIELNEIKFRYTPVICADNKTYKPTLNASDTDKLYDLLITSLFKQEKYNEAKGVANKHINILCRRFNERYSNIPTEKIKEYNENKTFIEKLNRKEEAEYKAELEKWNNSYLRRLFFKKPRPPYVNSYNKSADKDLALELLDKIRDKYSFVADICKNQGEKYSAEVCSAVVHDFKYYMPRIKDVIQRRVDNIEYIGDLYPEIKEEK